MDGYVAEAGKYAMKLGDCLIFHQPGTSVRLTSDPSSVPVGQARHNLGFDILLNLTPFFAFLWRTGREKRLKIARRNVGHDATILDRLIILNYCVTVNMEIPIERGRLGF